MKKDALMIWVGVTVLVAFMSTIAILVFVEVPSKNRELLLVMLGMVEAAMMALVGYYFGSNKGSKDKQEQLNKR